VRRMQLFLELSTSMAHETRRGSSPELASSLWNSPRHGFFPVQSYPFFDVDDIDLVPCASTPQESGVPEAE